MTTSRPVPTRRPRRDVDAPDDGAGTATASLAPPRRNPLTDMDQIPTPSSTASGGPWLLYLIKQVELAAKQHFDAILEPYGVTVNQFTALTVLDRNPGMTSARLARNSFVRVQAMAQTMAALEARGLIHREIDPESRRQLRTSITSEGHALMNAVAAPIEQLQQDMLHGLTPGQVEIFASALRSVRVSLGGVLPH